MSAAAAATVNNPPFGPYGIWDAPTGAGTGATAVFATSNPSRCAYGPTQPNVSEVIFSDLDVTASLVITIRVGFEITVSPTSTYIGQVGTPMIDDPVAMRTYQLIAREMLAGYPAEYNLFGALFNVIKGIAGKAIPGLVTGLGNLLGSKPRIAPAPQVSDSITTNAS